MAAGDLFQGRRVPCPYHPDGGLIDQWAAPGDYFFYPGQGWRGVTPNGHEAALYKHAVVVHEDLTITVSPSIKVSDHTGELWHGYLEHGVWREV